MRDTDNVALLTFLAYCDKVHVIHYNLEKRRGKNTEGRRRVEECDNEHQGDPKDAV